jgi:hypothetical protein
MAIPGKPGAELRAQIEAENSKKSHASEELAANCQRLEEECAELRARYDMYFLGVEKREPSRQRSDLKKQIAHLMGVFTRNTGLRFRIQTLHARFLSYERLWTRAAREREEGTYHRDIFKARLRGKEEPKEAAPPPGAKADAKKDSKAEPAKAAPATAKPPPTPKPGVALADGQMRALYDAYITAKKRCNEDTSKLSYDSVSKSVLKQIPDLINKFKAKSVDFKVVIKDGRAILKAVPKT